MKTHTLALLALALSSMLSTSAFASARNLVVCGWNGNDDAITIHEDVGGQVVALFSMVDHGTAVYSVEENATAEENEGAERVYEGRGIKLVVKADSSVLSIPELSVRDEAFDCEVKN